MVDILSSDRTVPVVIVMIAGHLTNLRRCMAKLLLLSHIPCKDIWSMLLPPILFHLPTQVYSMQSIIVHNMVGSLLRQPKLSKTRSGWCVSTMPKHTSGTLAIHVSSLQHRSHEGGRSLPHMATT